MTFYELPQNTDIVQETAKAFLLDVDVPGSGYQQKWIPKTAFRKVEITSGPFAGCIMINAAGWWINQEYLWPIAGPETAN